MWSIGVITFILLVGSPPFHATKVTRILYKIVHNSVKYDSEIWDNLTIEALDFVNKVLCKNPDQRLTPAAALKHDWIRQNNKSSNNDNPIKPEIIEKLVKLKAANTLKKEIFIILMNSIPSKTKEKWNKYFENLDADHEGTIKVSKIIEKLDDFECSSAKRK